MKKRKEYKVIWGTVGYCQITKSKVEALKMVASLLTTYQNVSIEIL